MVWEAVGGFSAGLAKSRTISLRLLRKNRLEWDGLVWQSREWEVSVAKIQVEMEARKAEERESSGWF